MKRTITTLALAAPLATIAIGLGGTSAMAQPGDSPTGTVTNAELAPTIPDDKAPLPEEEPRPEGPGDITIPDPCPTHGPCGDGPDDEDGKDPGDPDPGDKVGIPVPKRIDAGAGSSDEGLDLTWLVAGTALITASGAAYAVRRRTLTRA